MTSDSTVCTSGTYHTSSYGTTIYPPPAPNQANAFSLDAFNGGDPNGEWSLYVYDDSGSDSGSIDGFTLAITVNGFGVTVTPSPTPTGVPLSVDIDPGDVQGLIDAVAQANNDCVFTRPVTINLAPGSTYTLTTPMQPDNGLVINCEIVINGNGSIIERDAGAEDFRLFDIAEGAFLTLDSVTVQGGHPAGVASAIAGGGAIAGFGDLALVNSTLRDNVVEGNGAGGAINIYYGTVTIDNSTLTNNQVIGDPGNPQGGGGAIYLDGWEGIVQRISNSTITNNSAPQYGGGAWIIYTPITIEDTVIEDNSAPFGGGFAGGGYLYLDMIHSRLANNSASEDGGGFWTDYGQSIVRDDSVIMGNSAGTSGSAISGYNTTVTGSCIVNNTGPDPDVRRTSDGTVDVSNNWWGDPSGPSGAGTGTGDFGRC